jgi:hypothetical protein
MLVKPTQRPVLTLNDNDRLCEWTRHSLLTQSMHFVDSPFAEGDGRYRIAFAPTSGPHDTHPRGACIYLDGGQMQSWYRIRDSYYTQICRYAPGTPRRVNTIERHETAPDGRLYATHYVMTYFAEHTDTLIGLESYVNEFVSFCDLLLPARRTITFVENGQVRVRMITLGDHCLL